MILIEIALTVLIIYGLYQFIKSEINNQIYK
jgi:hypothetical protein